MNIFLASITEVHSRGLKILSSNFIRAMNSVLLNKSTIFMAGSKADYVTVNNFHTSQVT